MFKVLLTQKVARVSGQSSVILLFHVLLRTKLTANSAESLVQERCNAVSEGANMPSTPEAIEHIPGKLAFSYGPAKAANAGGVATSGLEMTQN